MGISKLEKGLKTQNCTLKQILGVKTFGNMLKKCFLPTCAFFAFFFFFLKTTVRGLMAH